MFASTWICSAWQDRAYLIGTVDDKDVEKIERELGWKREEELEDRQSFMTHNSNKALQIELKKEGTGKEEKEKEKYKPLE